jgi:hypothetical protein
MCEKKTGKRTRGDQKTNLKTTLAHLRISYYDSRETRHEMDLSHKLCTRVVIEVEVCCDK